MQVTDHVQRQRTLAVEYLVNPIGLADAGYQILGGEPGLLHAEFDCLNRVGRGNGVVLVFVRLDQGDQYVEFIALGGADLGRMVEVVRHSFQCDLIVVFIADGTDVHGVHSTEVTSIASYWACVPINLM
ncbi:hypothetical protein D3C71_1327450 [compost metagenome]